MNWDENAFHLQEEDNEKVFYEARKKLILATRSYVRILWLLVMFGNMIDITQKV